MNVAYTNIETDDRLYDMVYGFIYLTKDEMKVINTPIFQRLHHIKQLGLDNIIFPNAVHTRFSHSLGVMHIMDQIIKQIRKETGDEAIDEPKHKTLRLAALLHDIGHFPFSHTGEKATAKVYEEKNTEEEVEDIAGEEKARIASSGTIRKNTKLHELISEKIVTQWKRISTILGDKYDLKEIGRIICSTENLLETTLLHAELDADRLDYLLRDARFCGVQYGNIELEQITSALTCVIDKKENNKFLCATDKNLHAIEHYVLARYFMYSQIFYSPKIYFLDKVLQDIFASMIELKHFYTRDQIEEIISTNDAHKYLDYNDSYALVKMRKLHDEFANVNGELGDDSLVLNENIKLLLSGQIPIPIISEKKMVNRSDLAGKIKNWEKLLIGKANKFCENEKIPNDSVMICLDTLAPTKMQSSYPPTEDIEEDTREEAIRILDKKTPRGFKYLVELERSILQPLGQKTLLFLYIFVNDFILIKRGKNCKTIKEGLKSFIKDEIEMLPF